MNESFITTHPELLKEWDYEKNDAMGYKPENFSPGSGKKAWWKCRRGHSWSAVVGARTNRNSGCPYCSGNKVLAGFNDLATKNPALAAEWNQTKNRISPSEISFSSGKKVWWQCEKGHEWDDTVDHRSKGRNCPICSGHRVLVGYNDLEFTHPEIASEWNYERNTLFPSQVTSGSQNKVWWKCEHGHEWQTTIALRTSQNTGCPYCSGHKVQAGFNDLATTDPELVLEWHPSKNTISPNCVSRGTKQSVWWRCKSGHEWKAPINNRACSGTGCPVCSGKQVLVGYNDFAFHYPSLAEEWHPTKNKGLQPTEVTRGSNKKVWWLGKCGHEWENTIDHRVSRGDSCPICSGQQVLVGYNDLATSCPTITAEWHPTKNEGLLPSEVTKGSNKKVWWLGKCGHEWVCTIVGRVKNNSSCPYCSNVLVLQGFNDLESQFPEIAKEWHPTKNRKLLPSQIQFGSGKEAWWKCKKGHEWKIRVVNRTKYKTGCPYCRSQSSFPEQAILYYLRRDLPHAVANRDKVTYEDDRIEIDVYIPSIKVGVEYDGIYWHRDRKQKDKEKNEKLSKLGIKLIRVIESKVNKVEKSHIYYNCYSSKGQNLSWAITQLENELGIAPNATIDVESDYLIISELYRLNEVENSLAIKYPQLAEEWHPTKNGELLPTKIYGGSTGKVWWLGKCGHEWQESPNKRTTQKSKCPYCAGRRILKGFNDLASQYPDIANDWHPEKNNGIQPGEIVCGSMKKIWWQCSKGHEYLATVEQRTSRNTGCPYCAGVRILRGYNDFATKCPDLAKEWHPTKNIQQPYEFSKSSNKKVWWQCDKGHEWESSIYNRTRSNKPCPICSKK